MIDIVELMPERPNTILNEGLDKLTVLEDREIYYYFRDSVFFKELDQFISNKDKKSASKIKSTDNISAGDKTKINYENNLVRSRFIKKFETVRQNYYLYNDRIHSYTINNIKSLHQWENSELINGLEILAQLRRKKLFNIFFGNYK